MTRPAPHRAAAIGASRQTVGEATYRSRQVAGLLIVGIALVAFALARANWHEVFPLGWWHVW